MVYLLKMVIFHGYVSHNQMVMCISMDRNSDTYGFNEAKLMDTMGYNLGF